MHVKITPTRAVEMTPFAYENGNLFGCVSKSSCCEYLVKDTRSEKTEKMTQLSQAPLTTLFLVVSLSILYRKHFCVFVFFTLPVYISATGLRSTLILMFLCQVAVHVYRIKNIR